MNKGDKEYIDQKFADAQLVKDNETALVREKLRQRKKRLLVVFSVYAVIMLIIMTVLIFYFINQFN